MVQAQRVHNSYLYIACAGKMCVWYDRYIHFEKLLNGAGLSSEVLQTIEKTRHLNFAFIYFIVAMKLEAKALYGSKLSFTS